MDIILKQKERDSNWRVRYDTLPNGAAFTIDDPSRFPNTTVWFKTTAGDVALGSGVHGEPENDTSLVYLIRLTITGTYE